MMRPAIALLYAVIATQAWAQQPAPFAHGDAKAGETLVKSQCMGCHAAMFNGDAERIFTRSDRKIKSPEQLLAQIRGCNSNLKKNWSAEEEQNAAAYLNREYYKFE